jgi:integrase
MARLISLPLWIYHDAEKDRKSGVAINVPHALEVESALPILILSSLPVRLSTLTHTALSQIHWPDKDRAGWIYWPKEYSKTNKPLRAVLAPWKMQILESHIEHYRPALAEPGNPWLFPGRRLGYELEPRAEQTIAENLKDVIWRKLGLEIRTHLWRKLMAGLLFDATRDDRVVRYLLGHSPNSSATNVYIDQLRERWASAKLEEVTDTLLSNRDTLYSRGRRAE